MPEVVEQERSRAAESASNGGPGNGAERAAVPPKGKKPGSLTRDTLIQMAIRLAAVIVAATAISYFHIVETLSNQALTGLQRNVAERAQREREIFSLAEDNMAIASRALLKRVTRLSDAEVASEWASRVEHRPDGTWRQRKATWNMEEQTGIFVGKGFPLTQDLKRRVVASFQLVDQYGPAWRDRFADFYYTTPENVMVLYWADNPWCESALPSLYMPNEEYVWAADLKHDPQRRTVWTGLYYDHVAKVWMVSVEKPVDLNGRWIATAGQDVTLDKLMQRTVNDHLPGAYNILVRDDSRLIAHPQLMREIEKGEGKLDVKGAGDAHLSRIFAKVQTRAADQTILDNARDNEYLAVAKIPEPGWYFITVFPKSLVLGPAQETARIILFLGLLSLVIELTVLYFVLNRQIATPLRGFVGATERMAGGDFDVQLDGSRNDELGRLGQSFNRMARAISERDARLAGQNAELERQVEARTGELREALAEAHTANQALVESKSHLEVMRRDAERAAAAAEEANRAKSTFLANMSHELRTPLNAIIGFSEVLTDQTFGELNKRQSRYVGNILTSGKHLLSLINDILDLAKVESGKMQLEPTELTVPDVLRVVETVVKPLAQKKGQTLEVEAVPDLPAVLADEGKLKQVMYNLVSNAIKYTPDGGTIRVGAEVVRDPRVTPDQDSLRISVQDSGVGIKPEDFERVFAEFEQLDDSYARQQQGTGLGLALTRRLVELHGGRIWVESEGPGKGSIFRFVIPLQAKDPTTAEGVLEEACRRGIAAGGETSPDGRPLVLIVEDDPAAAELLAYYLSEGGYATAHAPDGDQALAMARELQPHAITLDVMMQKKGGWEVLAELKSASETHDIPVIMVSMTEERQLGLALGATDYLVKPVSRSRLLQAVSRAGATTDGKASTVLVVDDMPEMVELLTRTLEGAGFSVLQAFGGREGIQLATEKLPDVIVLDLMMPEVTGFDVVQALESHPRAREIPILIFTAKELTEEDHARLSQHVQAVLSKSGRDDLLRELQRHRSRSRAES